LGCDACLTAVGAEEKILIVKGLGDFLQKGLRHKVDAALLAHLHFNGPYVLFWKDLEETSQANFVPQFGRVLWTRVHTGAATNTLIVGIVEYSIPPLILRLQGTRRAAQFAGGATRASIRVQPGPVEKEGSHEDHGLAAQHMDDSHVFFQESNPFQGTMSEEIPGQERECGKDNQDEITHGSFGSKLGSADMAKDKVSGNPEKDKGHPVGEYSWKGGPRPLKSRLFPERYMSGEPDRDNEQAEMEYVAKSCVERSLGDSFVKGQQNAAEDGKGMRPVPLGILAGRDDSENEKGRPHENCPKENDEYDPQQGTFNERVKIHEEPPLEKGHFPVSGHGSSCEKETFDVLVTEVHHPETQRGRHHTGTLFVVKAKVPLPCR
jgi:hypothetical protein